MARTQTPTPSDINRIAHVLKFQFPSADFKSLLAHDDLRVSYSKKTKRINHIFLGDTMLFSLRATDGRFIPTIHGAKHLLDMGLSDNIIKVADEAVDFVKRGKSLYNRHVLEILGEISPNSEVVLVDSSMNLLAVGTAMHPGYAMLELNHGVAVKPKHYFKD